MFFFANCGREVVVSIDGYLKIVYNILSAKVDFAK